MGNRIDPAAAAAGSYAPVATFAEPQPQPQPPPLFPPLAALFGRARPTIEARAAATVASAEAASARIDFVNAHAVLARLTRAIDDNRVKATKMLALAKAARKHEGEAAAQQYRDARRRLLQQNVKTQRVLLAMDAAVSMLEQQHLSGDAVLALTACARDMSALLADVNPDQAADVADRLNDLMAQADDMNDAVAGAGAAATAQLAPTPWHERDAAAADDTSSISSWEEEEEEVEAKADSVRGGRGDKDDMMMMEEVSLI